MCGRVKINSNSSEEAQDSVVRFVCNAHKMKNSNNFKKKGCHKL